MSGKSVVIVLALTFGGMSRLPTVTGSKSIEQES
jgi:hypothetical protein